MVKKVDSIKDKRYNVGEDLYDEDPPSMGQWFWSGSIITGIIDEVMKVQDSWGGSGAGVMSAASQSKGNSISVHIAVLQTFLVEEEYKPQKRLRKMDTAVMGS